MAVANVEITDTFDAWRIKTNQIIQESNQSFFMANSAYNYSNTAILISADQANTARLHANGAYNQGNTAFVHANGAYNQANTARLHANGAYNQANTLYFYANTIIYDQANTARLHSNSAYIQANTTRLHANSGFDQANVARLHANTGFDQANVARLHANTGFDQANTARIHANTGFDQANTTRIHANSGFDQANTAFTRANDALGRANTIGASSNAWTNTVFGYSNTKFLANTTGVFTGSLTTTGSISDSIGNIRTVPRNSQTAAYQLTTTDIGKFVSITTGGIVVPAGTFVAGDVISIYNNSGTSQNITGPSVTMYIGGTSITGARTIAQRGIVTILCVSTSPNEFVIAGSGLS